MRALGSSGPLPTHSVPPAQWRPRQTDRPERTDAVNSHSNTYVQTTVVDWPQDADGDGLRALKNRGFDFAKPSLIDFNVEFQSWPPHREALRRLARDYPSATVCSQDGDQTGHLEFQVYALVTYELVTNTQSHVTDLMAPYKGRCSSWGVHFTPRLKRFTQPASDVHQ
jgi:hypothetical protein